MTVTDIVNLQRLLKQSFHYAPITGVFSRIRPSGGMYPVGCKNSRGYLQINFNGRLYKCHRLAFLYINGVFPVNEVDHIDNNKLNNRWSNLRECTRGENNYNYGLSSHNTSGVKGVSWHKGKEKWQARINVAGKSIYLGSYKELQEAKQVVRDYRTKVHGEFVNHGDN